MRAPFPWSWRKRGILVICGKKIKHPSPFPLVDNRFALVKSYPCIVGANGLDKKKPVTFATPVGNYFFLRYTLEKSLSRNMVMVPLYLIIRISWTARTERRDRHLAAWPHAR